MDDTTLTGRSECCAGLHGIWMPLVQWRRTLTAVAEAAPAATEAAIVVAKERVMADEVVTAAAEAGTAAEEQGLWRQNLTSGC